MGGGDCTADFSNRAENDNCDDRQGKTETIHDKKTGLNAGISYVDREEDVLNRVDQPVYERPRRATFPRNGEAEEETG